MRAETDKDARKERNFITYCSGCLHASGPENKKLRKFHGEAGKGGGSAFNAYNCEQLLARFHNLMIISEQCPARRLSICSCVKAYARTPYRLIFPLKRLFAPYRTGYARLLEEDSPQRFCFMRNGESTQSEHFCVLGGVKRNTFMFLKM